MALLNCTRQARAARMPPRSSCQVTRNVMIRSGSVSRSRMRASSYSGRRITSGDDALGHFAHRLVELGLARVAADETGHEFLQPFMDARNPVHLPASSVSAIPGSFPRRDMAACGDGATSVVRAAS